MATLVVPFKPGGKTRLGDGDLARAMLEDVVAACSRFGPTRVADGPGGQGAAVEAALATVRGPVVIVNADVPCVTTDEIAQLIAATPALVAARDGTTNALSLGDARDFRPLYGPESAARFGLPCLELAGLQDDVDTWDDLMRVAQRVGPNTRRALQVRV
jgi:2-phospho-L-lactate guanylyltransferase (CobY/MobA/RfbA family)